MSSLTNALRILQCYSTETPDLGVTEIASRLAMPKSSVSRLMRTMSEAGLLKQDGARRTYVPGVLAFQLGNLYQRHLKVLDLIDAALKELVEESGLTGYVGVLNGTDVVIIQVRQGTYPVRLVLEKGYRVPAFVTAIGLALLARLTDEELRRMHPAELRYDETDLTSDIETLLADVRHVRETGFAAVSGTTFVGFGAVGVAVQGRAEMQPMAFSLSFPQMALSQADRDAMARRLVETCRQIGIQTGDEYWSRFPREQESAKQPLCQALGAGLEASRPSG